jgi:hypothetical protein
MVKSVCVNVKLVNQKSKMLFKLFNERIFLFRIFVGVLFWVFWCLLLIFIVLVILIVIGLFVIVLTQKNVG